VHLEGGEKAERAAAVIEAGHRRALVVVPEGRAPPETQVTGKDAPAPAGRPFTLRDQLYVSCLWFSYNLMWGALIAIVIPNQVEAIVGQAEKERLTGYIGALGATVALFIAPIAGALSDRCRYPSGRRKPYLLIGAVINCAFLLTTAAFGPGSLVWLFVLSYLGLQLGANWWGGPYAGLIPDVVPKEYVGRASGWQAFMTAVGFLVGALAAGVLARPVNYWPIYLLIAGVLGATIAATWFGVREPPPAPQGEKLRLRPFLRSFLLDPRQYRNFYWVLITRAFVTMGVYSIFSFFQFFLADIVKMKDPVASASHLIATIMVAGIPATLIAGAVSDRHGRKPLVYLSGTVMAAACITYVFVSYAPSWTATLLIGALFGIGNGAYQAVDWALAVDVLPGGEDAAKDMGIWHVAIVLPQIVGPAVSGAVLGAFKDAGSLLMGYTVVFIIAAVWFVLGTVFVRQIRGVR